MFDCRYQPYPQLEYRQVMFYHQVHATMDNMTSVSTRQQRNQAEKNRRDKLNKYIHELSTLVPIINYAPKKLDKTSILRLAATYIRLHNVVYGTSKKDPQQSNRNYLPEFLTSINWSENILEDIGGGMMLIVSGAGKVIFISNAVEKILGHTQIELMGHSLYSLTCLEDHSELRRNLSPDDSVSITPSSGGDAGSDSDSDSSSGPPTPPPFHHSFSLQGHDNINDTSADVSPQRRSFYIRLRQRAVSKSDHPQYELLHVVGHLRVPKRRFSQPSTSRKGDQPTNNNETVLVAVARPYKEKRLVYLSLSEAYREEFVTRHAIDGSIIYTDHRISTVSGYLTEEVIGSPGFKFIHKDDMKWTMIALRQMYYRGQTYGCSVYRLQTKTGKFIFVKTHGYLEINESNDDLQSFLCMNTLVSEAEGFQLAHKMKELYTPLIHEDTSTSLIIDDALQHKKIVREYTSPDDVIEDLSKINLYVQYMLTNIPPVTSYHADLNTILDAEDLLNGRRLAQMQLMARTMPPITEQAARAGVQIQPLSTTTTTLSTSDSALSPKTPVPKSTPPSPSITTTAASAATTQLSRPSVLRRAPGPPNLNYQVPNEVSVVKRIRTDEHGHGIVVSDTSSVKCRADVVVSSGKRKLEEVEWSSMMVSNIGEAGLSLPSTFSYQPAPLQPISSFSDLQQTEMDSNNPLLEQLLALPALPEIEQHFDEYDLQHLSQAGNQVWDKPDKLDTELYKSHYNLGSNFEMQETQISAIEQAIDSVPRPNMADQVLNSSMILNELKAELKKEKQTLITICQDHKSIYNMD